ncbi:hypothetical protein [Gimesia panareensis]|uniref:hypothetical protein n=1 Tax=Gimesia panareensis TaxID=2527978 RepID=UPI001189DDA7|nr:hypothetical protein [Gimesia panareensis]QDU50869.1 hypothetical protein Pan110_32300 [Gimesia panareensis]
MKRRNKHSDDGDQRLTSGERTFLVSLEPINEHITTDDLLRKLQLVAGGCGIRINSAQLVSREQGGCSMGPSSQLF